MKSETRIHYEHFARGVFDMCQWVDVANLALLRGEIILTSTYNDVFLDVSKVLFCELINPES